MFGWKETGAGWTKKVGKGMPDKGKSRAKIQRREIYHFLFGNVSLVLWSES